MGVPHFFSWLISRYPMVKSSVDQRKLPVIDWLFLDLNGILYRCAKEDASVFKEVLKGRKFEEIFMHAFTFINEIVQQVHPQKMVYFTFDGVAPRAKMNQQRARRFKSDKKYRELDEALQDLGILGRDYHFKNNSISPGTEFMFELNRQFKFFIQKKFAEDDRWKKLQVIYSGVDIPGEGEHKALEYIRKRTQEPGFDPNTTICIYGPDADLIHLSLTTHLPFVCILREQLKPRLRKTNATKRTIEKSGYDFIWINLLREYFEIEFSCLKEKMGDRYDFEKVIDDFIFLCFFIGNDFLPRVFCMDIKIGTFDKLVEIFKETLCELDGYINQKGVICWYRATKLFKKIAEFELKFIGEKIQEQEASQKHAQRFKNMLENVEGEALEENMEAIQKNKILSKQFKNIEKKQKKDDEDEEDGNEESGAFDYDEENKYYSEDDPKSQAWKQTNKKKPQKFEEDKGANDDDDDDEEKTDDTPIQPSDDEMQIGEAEKYVLKYSNEEKISRLLSAGVIENDLKFMKSLVKMYQNNQSDARKFYYAEKFDFNIDEKPQNLTDILTAYMQGLQFVLSYYYTNCPSWLWYYPYYYSPLISDLSTLMEKLNLPQESEKNLIKFDLGEPYPPYKQLLLILPIGSLHLLPEPLRKAVDDENAALHKYYPSTFELDPFGAVFDSEYIAKIPFVDEDLLKKEYEKVFKNSPLSEDEILRNQVGKTYTYKWDSKMEEYEVKSTLPEFFENFKSKVVVEPLDVDKLPFDPTKILDRAPKNSFKYHKSFPSLHFIKDKTSRMAPFTRKEVPFLKVQLKIKQKLQKADPKILSSYLDQFYHCEYPFLVNCELIAIATPDHLITNWDYFELPFQYKKAEHKEYYQELVANVHDEYNKEFGIEFEQPNISFAVIQVESESRKDSLGNVYDPAPRLEYIPFEMLLEVNIKPAYRGLVDPFEKSLQQEFPKGSEALICIGPNIGSLSKVVSYNKNSIEFDNVDVVITKTVPKLQTITSAIAKKYDDQMKYRSVNDVANSIGVKLEVLLTLLDSVVVKTETDQNKESIYPEKFDLGLSLINKKNHTIVPELIICHELDKQKPKGRKVFPHFQMAPEAVEIIKEYSAKFRLVIKAIEQKLDEMDPTPISASYIFPGSENPNLEVLQVYIWIMKSELSTLVLANKASKVIPREGVHQLEKILNQQSNIISDPANPHGNKSFPYNPNFLIPNTGDSWIPPLFFRRPPWHKIGDRVVNLKTNGQSFAPFGWSGTVIGILGNKPENGVWEIKIEILFDKPFIGGTNLSGRCSWGRGAVVDFDDVYNITSWTSCIKPRDRRKSFYFPGWDGKFNRSYLPEFQTASESSDLDDQQDYQEQQPNKVHYKNMYENFEEDNRKSFDQENRNLEQLKRYEAKFKNQHKQDVMDQKAQEKVEQQNPIVYRDTEAKEQYEAVPQRQHRPDAPFHTQPTIQKGNSGNNRPAITSHVQERTQAPSFVPKTLKKKVQNTPSEPPKNTQIEEKDAQPEPQQTKSQPVRTEPPKAELESGVQRIVNVSELEGSKNVSNSNEKGNFDFNQFVGQNLPSGGVSSQQPTNVDDIKGQLGLGGGSKQKKPLNYGSKGFDGIQQYPQHGKGGDHHQHHQHRDHQNQKYGGKGQQYQQQGHHHQDRYQNQQGGGHQQYQQKGGNYKDHKQGAPKNIVQRGDKHNQGKNKQEYQYYEAKPKRDQAFVDPAILSTSDKPTQLDDPAIVEVKSGAEKINDPAIVSMSTHDLPKGDVNPKDLEKMFGSQATIQKSEPQGKSTNIEELSKQFGNLEGEQKSVDPSKVKDISELEKQGSNTQQDSGNLMSGAGIDFGKLQNLKGSNEDAGDVKAVDLSEIEKKKEDEGK